ncbi:hypothetical protein DRP77_07945 [Candidatus Poribacteria bacterium]|nr:MAG: hypothetical protein DRP77_07945 [Candidatus Poribacteria bacterium]
MRVRRRHELDWIRVFVVLHLIPYHISVFIGRFNMTGAERGAVSRAIIDLPAMFANPWHMHVMFLISGMNTAYSLRFRSIEGYVLNRLRRLLIPLLFSLLVILPFHHFYWRFPPLSPMVEESHYRNFIAFLIHDYPRLLWMRGTFFLGNLWFVYYLLVFSLLCLPLFAILRGERGRAFIGRLARACEPPGVIMLFGLPLAIGTALLAGLERGARGWNIVNDLTRSFQYITCFVYGYLIGSEEGMWDAIGRHWKAAGIGLIALNGVFAALRRPIPLPLRAFETWLWLALVLGAGRALLGFENRFLRYMREAFYPFYILHQPLMLAVGHYMRGWAAPLLVHALAVGVSTLLGTWLFYELGVRRWNAVRFLFGLRPI